MIMNGLEEIPVKLVKTVSEHPQRWLAWASAATFFIALTLDSLPKNRLARAKRTTRR